MVRARVQRFRRRRAGRRGRQRRGRLGPTRNSVMSLSAGRPVNVIRRWALASSAGTGEIKKMTDIKENDKVHGLMTVMSLAASDFLFDTPASFVVGNDDYSLYREMRLVSMNATLEPTNALGERRGVSAMAILPAGQFEPGWATSEFTADYDNIMRFPGASAGSGTNARRCFFRPTPTDVLSYSWEGVSPSSAGKKLVYIVIGWRATDVEDTPTVKQFSASLTLRATIRVRENAVDGVKLNGPSAPVWPDATTSFCMKIGRKLVVMPKTGDTPEGRLRDLSLKDMEMDNESA